MIIWNAEKNTTNETQIIMYYVFYMIFKSSVFSHRLNFVWHEASINVHASKNSAFKTTRCRNIYFYFYCLTYVLKQILMFEKKAADEDTALFRSIFESIFRNIYISIYILYWGTACSSRKFIERRRYISNVNETWLENISVLHSNMK